MPPGLCRLQYTVRRKGQGPFQTVWVTPIGKRGEVINHLPLTARPVGPNFAPMPDRVGEPSIPIVLRRHLLDRPADLPS